ncbi:MAG: enoyl-CoA hydratase/isomerase family protein [Alphaproteobacteria bacterium]|nr:enoyl-CoA hydratase/isomerase family protein [Alphaproteobacteria bacterium]
MTSDVKFSRAGALARIVLDRPKALNALTLEMIHAITPQMRAWAHDPAVAAVAITGEGGKAFCAGGDVRGLYDARQRDPNAAVLRDFFWNEYRLNRLIHRYPKPYVAVLDGITMGGGVGLSVNGRFRVATEKTLFAMPETAIGLFPDVGGSHFLSRAPGELGVYLALSSQRIRAADMLYCGFATHYVPSAEVPALVAALETRPAADVLREFNRDAGPAPLAEHREAIDRCFAHDRVEDILAALAREPGEWAHALRAGLATKSPTAMKVSLREIREGKRLVFEDCMRMEFRLSQACMRGHDFFEGVRAVLVDKDNAPRWQPATLDAVDAALVDRHFAPLANELVFDE